MRLMQLYHGVENSLDNTIEMFKKFLKGASLGALNVDTEAHSTMYFRYYLEFLCREGLLSHQLEPLGLVGLITHLSWLEPGNFILLQLFREGVFADICENKELSKREKEVEIVTLLACILNPRPLQSFLPSGNASKVTLKVPEVIHKIASKFND